MEEQLSYYHETIRDEIFYQIWNQVDVNVWYHNEDQNYMALLNQIWRPIKMRIEDQLREKYA